MSWKAQLSRRLHKLRFFACPESPSSKGLISWYNNNYAHIKALNPTLPLMLRTTENAMPAITTELDFTTDDLLKYMLQAGTFKNEDGSVAQDRVEAAQDYLKTDWVALRRERWACKGFDPEHPFIDEIDPDWRLDSSKTEPLAKFLELKDASDAQMEVIKSGPDQEFLRAENSLLMCQRVDLWCAGEAEVEAAVRHLASLGRRLNYMHDDHERAEYITEFYPGAGDL